MHIKSSFYHAMKSISTAFTNIMPGQCRTLHHKIRVVKNTQNVPVKKTKKAQSEVKFSPMTVGVNGIVSQRFDGIRKKQDQSVCGLQHDPLFSQLERNSIAGTADMKGKKPEREDRQMDAATTRISMPASSSKIRSVLAQTDLFSDCQTGSDDDLARCGEVELPCCAFEPLASRKEKIHIKQITTQAEIHGKPGERRALLPLTAPKKEKPLLARHEFVILPPKTRKKVLQRMVLQPLRSIGIQRIKNASLYIRSGGTLPSLASIQEYSPPTPQQSHELYAVFAKRRTQDAIAKTMQSIAALESRSGRTMSPRQPEMDKMDLQRQVVDDSFVAVDAYMKDSNVRLIIDKNGEMVI